MVTRKRIELGALALAAVAGLVVVVTLTWGRGSSDIASARPATDKHIVSYYSYAVKFICGYYDPAVYSGEYGYEGPVKPGNYATEVNIHNPNYYYGTGSYQRLPIYKKLVYLWGENSQGYFDYREPKSAGPTKIYRMYLRPDYATMDDCSSIYDFAKARSYDIMPSAFTIGFLVILSPQPLDVTAVYTAQSEHHASNGTGPYGGTSIEAETVVGRKVKVPVSYLGGAESSE